MARCGLPGGQRESLYLRVFVFVKEKQKQCSCFFLLSFSFAFRAEKVAVLDQAQSKVKADVCGSAIVSEELAVLAEKKDRKVKKL